MFCDQCGAQVPDSARFCQACGKAFGGAAPPVSAPTQGRVARHVRIVALLWLILSGFRLLSAVTLMGIGRGGIYIPGMPFFVHQMLSGIGFVFLIAAALGLAAGWGLLQRESWARMLAIVMGILNLFDPPFGTAIGIYTLWVLLPTDSEREYRQLPRAV
ncbi:MAG TPA: zinc ribbon domain-containing protein [Bryobacteraceae bacterium]